MSSTSISKTSKVSSGYMASSIKKVLSRNLQFLNLAFGSLDFFLTSTFPALKHHQPCTRRCKVLCCFSTPNFCCAFFSKGTKPKLLGSSVHLQPLSFLRRVASPTYRSPLFGLAEFALPLSLAWPPVSPPCKIHRNKHSVLVERKEFPLEIRAPAAAKVQEWKFASFEDTNFRARIYKYHC